jgi:hypothetical protein
VCLDKKSTKVPKIEQKQAKTTSEALPQVKQAQKVDANSFNSQKNLKTTA